MSRSARLAGVAVAGALALSACSLSAENAAGNTAAATAQACESAQELQATVDEVAGQAAGSKPSDVTVAQTQEAVKALKESYDALLESLGVVTSSINEQFKVAEEQYSDALADIDGSTPLDEAGDQVAQARQTLLDSYEQIISDLGCELQSEV